MDNDPKNNPDEFDDDKVVDYAKLKAKLDSDAKKLGFDDSDADDIPTEENTIFIMARHHIEFLKDAIKSNESGKVDHFKDSEISKNSVRPRTTLPAAKEVLI